ncbi:MAG: hypothetical protein IJN82_00245 [Clostridia bacterium]|nr:hypothetical protein [Clostridia bacterium]
MGFVERSKESLMRFLDDNPGKRVGIFLHTSVILGDYEELKSLFLMKHSSTSHRFYIPKNVERELLLLRGYGTYRRHRQHSQLVLEHCTVANHSLREFSELNIFSAYSCELAVFLFFEPMSAEKFACKARQKNVFYLYADALKSKNNYYLIRNVGRFIPRNPHTLDVTALDNPYQTNDILRVFSIKEQVEEYRIPCKELDKKFRGGEAFLFTYPQKPDKLFKIFRFKTDEAFVEKLRFLSAFSTAMPGCICPTELLYLDGVCVGYAMDYVEGENLETKLNQMEDDAERLKNARTLMTILLEQRLVQFIVTDLSTNNIRCGEDGKLHIVDCDSMEFMNYCGGGVTPPFGHPGVTKDYFYKKLRHPTHTDFSLGVILFRFIMGWDPLLQCLERDGDPQWIVDKFPFSNDSSGKGIVAPGCRVDHDCLEEWEKYPYLIRKAFVDVFNFKSSYDIGDWLIALNELIKLK